MDVENQTSQQPAGKTDTTISMPDVQREASETQKNAPDTQENVSETTTDTPNVQMNVSPSTNEAPNTPKANSAPMKNSNTGQANASGVSKETLWYLDNYILLRDYYDRTISRIAARCVRMGNIAMEEYPHYSYILDVLQEISETGNFVLSHKELHPYVERKIKGGIEALRRNLKEYELELQRNSSPDMIKEDASALNKMKDVLGEIDIKDDPTQGAGMNMDDLMAKLMKQNQVDTSQYETYAEESTKPDLERPKQPKGI